MTNKSLINQWLENNDPDSDFIKIRVLGQFPNTSSAQFIPTDLVERAMVAEARYNPTDPIICGVDVARYGDDFSRIRIRRGKDLRSYPTWKFAHKDTMFLAAKVAELNREHLFDAVFVDETGVGGGVVDRLRQIGGVPVIPINFSSRSPNPVCARMPDYMWYQFARMAEGRRGTAALRRSQGRADGAGIHVRQQFGLCAGAEGGFEGEWRGDLRTMRTPARSPSPPRWRRARSTATCSNTARWCCRAARSGTTIRCSDRREMTACGMCLSTPSPPKPYIPPAPPRYTDPNVIAAGEDATSRNRAAAGSALDRAVPRPAAGHDHAQDAAGAVDGRLRCAIFRSPVQPVPFKRPKNIDISAPKDNWNRRFTALENERSLHVAEWQAINENFSPRRARFWLDQERRR